LNFFPPNRGVDLVDFYFEFLPAKRRRGVRTTTIASAAQEVLILLSALSREATSYFILLHRISSLLWLAIRISVFHNLSSHQPSSTSFKININLN
jgi:hypothetical protein